VELVDRRLGRERARVAPFARRRRRAPHGRHAAASVSSHKVVRGTRGRAAALARRGLPPGRPVPLQHGSFAMPSTHHPAGRAPASHRRIAEVFEEQGLTRRRPADPHSIASRASRPHPGLHHKAAVHAERAADDAARRFARRSRPLVRARDPVPIDAATRRRRPAPARRGRALANDKQIKHARDVLAAAACALVRASALAEVALEADGRGPPDRSKLTRPASSRKRCRESILPITEDPCGAHGDRARRLLHRPRPSGRCQRSASQSLTGRQSETLGRAARGAPLESHRPEARSERLTLARGP
jgi:hypothetical protein